MIRAALVGSVKRRFRITSTGLRSAALRAVFGQSDQRARSHKTVVRHSSPLLVDGLGPEQVEAHLGARFLHQWFLKMSGR